jgi:hypothetical protein
MPRDGLLQMVGSTPGDSSLASKDDGVGFGNCIHFGHGLLPGQRERHISAIIIMVGSVRATEYIIPQNGLVSSEREHSQLDSLPKGMHTGLCMKGYCQDNSLWLIIARHRMSPNVLG